MNNVTAFRDSDVGDTLKGCWPVGMYSKCTNRCWRNTDLGYTLNAVVKKSTIWTLKPSFQHQSLFMNWKTTTWTLWWPTWWPTWMPRSRSWRRRSKACSRRLTRRRASRHRHSCPWKKAWTAPPPQHTWPRPHHLRAAPAVALWAPPPQPPRPYRCHLLRLQNQPWWVSAVTHARTH